MIKRLLIIFLSISGFGLMAQLETSADFKRQVFKKEFTLGLSGHSRGYGLTGRYLKFIDGYNKQGLEIDFTKLRHSKEVKTPNTQSYNASRGFVYNRINTFYSLRAGYIREKILFDKTDKGTVSIALVTSGGLSLGLLKPVYVVITTDPSTAIEETKIVRYNPADPLQSNVQGEANFFRGMGETNLYPGVYLKVGANFDYQLIEKKVTSLEAGIIYDYFFREVPIFYEMEGGEDINWTGFFQFYIAFNFGYRKN